MFDDDPVHSHSPPEDQCWVVTIKGDFEVVDEFCAQVMDVFENLQPEVSFSHQSEKDFAQATIHMKWNSTGLVTMLEGMIPNHVEVKQKREDKPCQDILKT